MNNPFYKTNNFFLLFESKEIAQKVRVDYGQFRSIPLDIEQAERDTRFLSGVTKSKVSFVRPDDIIYIIYGQDKNETDLVINVIVGERIGWIVNFGWIKFYSLESFQYEK